MFFELLRNPSLFYLKAMNYTSKDWVDTIKNSELPEIEKKRRLILVEKAYESNVPVIINLNHFSQLVGVKSGIINSMIKKPSKFYRTFEIPKRSGGKRQIVTPHNSLLIIQKWITAQILKVFQIHPAAFGYLKNKNVALNASNHIGAKEMLKIDLKDFFPSIKITRVRELFKRLGYSKEVTYLLSRLCCLNDSLPQGAASSPTISNIVLHTLDKRLQNFSITENITYSRYADDLIFSGESIPIDFKILAIMNINDSGFEVNSKKIIEYSGKQRKLVTGLLVTDSRIRLPKQSRRDITQSVYYLLKYGILDQIKRYNDIYYPDRILGRLGYWKQIEPENQYVIKVINQIRDLQKELMSS